MGIILKARKVLKKKVLLQLYHSFLTPYLIYCLEILGNASDIHVHLQPLITTQQKIVIIITFSSYCSHTNILFKHLNILPFKKLLKILKARKVLKKKVLLQLYHSFLTPYLIYCLEILGNASDIHVHLQPLITTQQKIVIIITFSSYCSHTNILFKHLNILPFKKLLFLMI